MQRPLALQLPPRIIPQQVIEGAITPLPLTMLPCFRQGLKPECRVALTILHDIHMFTDCIYARRHTIRRVLTYTGVYNSGIHSLVPRSNPAYPLPVSTQPSNKYAQSYPFRGCNLALSCKRTKRPVRVKQCCKQSVAARHGFEPKN